MSDERAPRPEHPSQEQDAALALALLRISPRRLGGISLRGGGPVREALIESFAEDQTLRRLPGHIDDERLLGGIDITASLVAGKPVAQSGLLEQSASDFLAVPMAERLSNSVAGKLAQAMDGADAPFPILFDDGASPDERAPEVLMERVAFHCDLREARAFGPVPPLPAKQATIAPPDDKSLGALAATAAALGIDSARAMIFALAAAEANAVLQGRIEIDAKDLEVATRLVLAPRATQFPQNETLPEEQEHEPPPEAPESEGEDNSDRPPPEDALQEMLLEAAAAAIPPDLLAQIAAGRTRRRGTGGGGGARHASKLRGKPLGARPGLPRGGARLALIDTLRTAAPWQRLRARDAAIDGTDSRLQVRKGDLRVRRFEERNTSVTIFAVDASGSAALTRLAEAKGAIELLLAQAYVKRSEVALLAFRGDSAELLLPPTRSLTRARRALAELPGGGGTPLASGINLARQIAESVTAKGRTAMLVFLTDGKANIASDGSASRSQAKADAQNAATRLAALHLESIVVDISPRPRNEAADFASWLNARYLPLPMADAKALHAAIEGAQTAREAA